MEKEREGEREGKGRGGEGERREGGGERRGGEGEREQERAPQTVHFPLIGLFLLSLCGSPTAWTPMALCLV